MSLYLNSCYDSAGLADQRESVIAFARYCLPQVFFYGMFVLVGQILNSRGRFGPMMWAPIANNVISVARARGLPARLRPRRQGREVQRVQHRPGDAARHRRHRRHHGAAADPAALPAGGRLPLPAPLRLPQHRPLPHAAARCVDGALRRGQPDRLHRGRPARLRRHRLWRRRRARHGLHRLLHDVPDRDGAALDHHRVAGHRDPAPAGRPGRRRATCAASPTPSAARCAPRWP